jgi:hypothetical protein
VGRWRLLETQRAIGLLVPSSVRDEQVQMRIEIETASASLERAHGADTYVRVTGATSQPPQNGVADQAHRGIEDGRPKGEQGADLERQADDDLTIGHRRQHVVQ